MTPRLRLVPRNVVQFPKQRRTLSPGDGAGATDINHPSPTPSNDDHGPEAA